MNPQSICLLKKKLILHVPQTEQTETLGLKEHILHWESGQKLVTMMKTWLFRHGLKEVPQREAVGGSAQAVGIDTNEAYYTSVHGILNTAH